MSDLTPVGMPPVRTMIFGNETTAMATGEFQGLPCVTFCENQNLISATHEVMAENGVTLMFANIDGALDLIKCVEESIRKFCRRNLSRPEVFTEFTQQNVEEGKIVVEVFSMKNTGEHGSTLCRADEAEFWDIALRPGLYENRDEPFEEWENLTREQAEKIVARLEELFPGISIDWVDA